MMTLDIKIVLTALFIFVACWLVGIFTEGAEQASYIKSDLTHSVTKSLDLASDPTRSYGK